MVHSDIELWLVRVAEIVTDNDDAALIDSHLSALRSDDAEAASLSAFSIVQIAGETASSSQHFDALADAPEMIADGDSALALSLSIVGASIAAATIEWSSRADAVAAREALSGTAQQAYQFGSLIGGQGLSYLRRISGYACRLLSDRAASLRPLVEVQVGVSLPSSVMAYRLYGRAGDASKLIGVSGVSTPLLMPVRFTAESPDAA